jgi:hypothetical protein
MPIKKRFVVSANLTDEEKAAFLRICEKETRSQSEQVEHVLRAMVQDRILFKDDICHLLNLAYNTGASLEEVFPFWTPPPPRKGEGEKSKEVHPAK